MLKCWALKWFAANTGLEDISMYGMCFKWISRCMECVWSVLTFTDNFHYKTMTLYCRTWRSKHYTQRTAQTYRVCDEVRLPRHPDIVACLSSLHCNHSTDVWTRFQDSCYLPHRRLSLCSRPAPTADFALVQLQPHCRVQLAAHCFPPSQPFLVCRLATFWNPSGQGHNVKFIKV